MATIEDTGKKRLNLGREERYYRVTIWTDGRGSHRERYPLGWMAETEADALRKRIKAAEELGVDVRKLLGLDSKPASTPSSKPQVPTLREWWGETFDGNARMHLFVQARGLSRAEQWVLQSTRLLILQLYPDLLITQVTAAHGDQFVALMRERKLSPRTRRSYLARWRQGMQVAVDDGLIAAVPRIRLPREESPRKQWHTPEQSAALLAVVQARVVAGEIPAATGLAILLGVELGLRPGEAYTRRWEDINWAVGTLQIRAAVLPDGRTWTPKTSTSSATIAVSSATLTALKEAWLSAGCPATGWICPSPHDPQKPIGDIGKALASCCLAAGIPVITPHGLRHSAASRWVQEGADIGALTEAGRWKSPDVPTKVYVHATRERGDAVLKRGSILERVPPPYPSVEESHTPSPYPKLRVVGKKGED